MMDDKFLGILYNCPDIGEVLLRFKEDVNDADEEVTTIDRDPCLYTNEGCESCSHGSRADLEFDCDCGKRHTVELRS